MSHRLRRLILIRPFQHSDQAAARQLILNGLGSHWGWIDETLNPDLNDIHAHYIVAGHLFVVAVQEEEIVGTGALVQESEGVSRMVRISVSANHQRQGIGRQLVAHLVQQAWARGDQRIVVETNLDWWDAIGLYQNFGFTEYDRDDESVYMHLNHP